MVDTLQNGTESASKPIDLFFPLPHAPTVRINLRLTIFKPTLLLFLTTTSADSPSTSCSLGSFVYAMPNQSSPSSPPLSTPLYTQNTTLDFATRLAMVLAKKTGRPVYVGNSISFAGAGRGGDVEEEMEGFRKVVETVVAAVKDLDGVGKVGA